MVMLDWQALLVLLLAVWKCAMMECGGQYVMTYGAQLMPLLCAEN